VDIDEIHSLSQPVGLPLPSEFLLDGLALHELALAAAVVPGNGPDDDVNHEYAKHDSSTFLEL